MVHETRLQKNQQLTKRWKKKRNSEQSNTSMTLQKAMDQWDDAILGMQNDMPQETELKWRFEVLMQDVPQLKQRWIQMKRECKREEDREPTYPEMYKEVKDHLEEKRKKKIKEYSQRQLGLRGNKENDRHQSILRQQAARETTEPPPDPWRDPAWENYKQKAEDHQAQRTLRDKPHCKQWRMNGTCVYKIGNAQTSTTIHQKHEEKEKEEAEKESKAKGCDRKGYSKGDKSGKDRGRTRYREESNSNSERSDRSESPARNEEPSRRSGRSETPRSGSEQSRTSDQKHRKHIRNEQRKKQKLRRMERTKRSIRNRSTGNRTMSRLLNIFMQKRKRHVLLLASTKMPIMERQ